MFCLHEILQELSENASASVQDCKIVCLVWGPVYYHTFSDNADFLDKYVNYHIS